MPHSPGEAVMLAGRVLAGAAAILAFYLAFFLYENEEGKWQNRLEDLWIAVDERARVTQSKSTALLNKLGETLLLIFNRVFGEVLPSFKGSLASINLSAVGFALLFMDHGVPSSQALSYLLGVVLAGVFIAAAVLPAIYQSRWAIIAASLPVLSLLLWMGISFGKDYGSTFVMVFIAAIVLLFVVLFNVIAILVLKAIFRHMSQSNSTARVVAMILGLTAFSLVAIVLTILGAALFLPSIVLNFATIVDCLLPDVLLILLFVHRLIWPAIGRLIYPLVRFKVVTNRKALVSFGTLCLTYALNLSHVGIKEILKLFA